MVLAAVCATVDVEGMFFDSCANVFTGLADGTESIRGT